MNLNEQAAVDLKSIVEDTTGGFGWPVTVTDPDGQTADLAAYTTDVMESIDVQTGTPVVGRFAHAMIPIASLREAGLGVPVGVADGSSKPWVVTFNDVQGNAYRFKVSEAMQDRKIGAVVCVLEAYKQ